MDSHEQVQYVDIQKFVFLLTTVISYLALKEKKLANELAELELTLLNQVAEEMNGFHALPEVEMGTKSFYDYFIVFSLGKIKYTVFNNVHMFQAKNCLFNL